MADGEGAHGLCLTRREGESVVIETPDGQRMLVSVARIEAGRVVLRFVGSRQVFNVARMELRLRAGRGV